MIGPNNLLMTKVSKNLKNYFTKMSQLASNTGICRYLLQNCTKDFMDYPLTCSKYKNGLADFNYFLL